MLDPNVYTPTFTPKELCLMAFEGMTKEWISLDGIKQYHRQIQVSINLGEVSWKDLGFTSAEVEERLRLAKVRNCRRVFEDMPFEISVSDSLAKYIIREVHSGITTWGELGFTEEAVIARIKK